MGRDYLSVEVWDLNTQRRPVETHQARRPSCASTRPTSTFAASCVPSAVVTASPTAPSAAGVALTSEACVGTGPSRARAGAGPAAQGGHGVSGHASLVACNSIPVQTASIVLDSHWLFPKCLVDDNFIFSIIFKRSERKEVRKLVWVGWRLLWERAEDKTPECCHVGTPVRWLV